MKLKAPPSDLRATLTCTSPLARDAGYEGITIHRYQRRSDQALLRGCGVCIIDEQPCQIIYNES